MALLKQKHVLLCAVKCYNQLSLELSQCKKDLVDMYIISEYVFFDNNWQKLH